MMQQPEQISSPPASPPTILARKRVFKEYKKRLLLQVILILVICFAVIIERIFYEVIIDEQNNMIRSLQDTFGLSTTQQDGTILPSGIAENGFVQFVSYLSNFKAQFLILTHVLITLYVGVNAMIASKVLYVWLISVYLVSFLQMFYSGTRPFWSDSDVFAGACLPSYNHPSHGVGVVCLFIAYTIYCFNKSKSRDDDSKSSVWGTIAKIVVAVVAVLVQLMYFVLGEQYLINIALGLVVVATLLLVLSFFNSYIDTIIKKSTIMSIDAKKYSFYWLLYLGIAETFALIVYSGMDKFLDVDWIQNYNNCLEYQDIQKTHYRYDEILGPWFTFLQTATIFGLIGAIFGIAYCFRNMQNLEWYAGKNIIRRIIRVLVANLFLVPSWLFISLLQVNQTDDSWMHKIGLNDFILDSVHFFVLYLWLFGYMPVFVLSKLNLNNKDQEDFYVVMNSGENLEG